MSSEKKSGFGDTSVLRARSKVGPSLPKTPAGIEGLDEVTGGGLPTGRTTLVSGSAGCGKTLLAMEFLVHDAIQYGDRGPAVGTHSFLPKVNFR